MARPRCSWIALSTAALLSGTGCFKSYVAVTFRPLSETASQSTATATPSFHAVRGSMRTVALRAPAACLREATSSPRGAGVAVRTRTVLESRCTIWLGALEAALAAKYKVVGWRELALRERDAGASGALGPGVELVLVVRELEAEPLLVSAADPQAVVLTAATARGAAVSGAKPPSRRVDAAIRELVATRFPDGALVGVRATLDLAAVPGAGGGPIWTYAARVSDTLSGAMEPRMLLRGRRGSWRPVAPRGWKPGDAATAANATPVDPLEARLRELAAMLAADVVARLTTEG